MSTNFFMLIFLCFPYTLIGRILVTPQQKLSFAGLPLCIQTWSLRSRVCLLKTEILKEPQSSQNDFERTENDLNNVSSTEYHGSANERELF
jgi:hypothetical protein